MEEGNIPEQYRGKQLDIQEARGYGSPEVAERAFLRIRTMLFDINHWHEVAGALSAQFVHVNSFGEPIEQNPREGDFIKIDIPGPGTVSGEGYDWVRVTELEDRPMDGFVQLTVQPCAAPMSTEDLEASHFFRAFASSSFVVKKEGLSVRVFYYGRNEEVNLENERFIDNVRNGLVGIGAKMGFSYPQWKALVSGLLEKSETQE